MLKIKNLSVSSSNKQKQILNNINIELREKEFLGILGESGCGKTTLLNAITGIIDKNLKISGDILFLKEEFKKISMILQDSINSLNPYEKIRTQLYETYLLHNNKENIENNIKMLLNDLGFEDINSIIHKYPYELSGGMRQRISIALSLMTNPKILLVDEPTTSLDILNQIRFIKLLKEIASKKNISFIYVSHDIKTLAAICNRIIVMKNGKIIEEGLKEEIINNPKEEYTKLLLNYL